MLALNSGRPRFSTRRGFRVRQCLPSSLARLGFKWTMRHWRCLPLRVHACKFSAVRPCTFPAVRVLASACASSSTLFVRPCVLASLRSCSWRSCRSCLQSSSRSRCASFLRVRVCASLRVCLSAGFASARSPCACVEATPNVQHGFSELDRRRGTWRDRV